MSIYWELRRSQKSRRVGVYRTLLLFYLFEEAAFSWWNGTDLCARVHEETEAVRVVRYIKWRLIWCAGNSCSRFWQQWPFDGSGLWKEQGGKKLRASTTARWYQNQVPENRISGRDQRPEDGMAGASRWTVNALHTLFGSVRNKRTVSINPENPLCSLTDLKSLECWSRITIMMGYSRRTVINTELGDRVTIGIHEMILVHVGIVCQDKWWNPE